MLVKTATLQRPSPGSEIILKLYEGITTREEIEEAQRVLPEVWDPASNMQYAVVQIRTTEFRGDLRVVWPDQVRMTNVETSDTMTGQPSGVHNRAFLAWRDIRYIKLYKERPTHDGKWEPYGNPI